MSRHRGARAVGETGGATGLATVVLALLSAGSLAALGLVGAEQLVPAPPHPSGAETRAVEPPATVVVAPPPGQIGQTSPPPAGRTTGPTLTPASAPPVHQPAEVSTSSPVTTVRAADPAPISHTPLVAPPPAAGDHPAPPSRTTPSRTPAASPDRSSGILGTKIGGARTVRGVGAGSGTSPKSPVRRSDPSGRSRSAQGLQVSVSRPSLDPPRQVVDDEASAHTADKHKRHSTATARKNKADKRAARQVHEKPAAHKKSANHHKRAAHKKSANHHKRAAHKKSATHKDALKSAHRAHKKAAHRAVVPSARKPKATHRAERMTARSERTRSFQPHGERDGKPRCQRAGKAGKDRQRHGSRDA